ncbi:GNAT family N-acetyltransferase [Asanoa hainanensis]|uniref:GNAT family N-acetyltransferase n=1 Tax=Asanoa hainanensis TaxID=560556 RepID=UPI0015C5EB7A
MCGPGSGPGPGPRPSGRPRAEPGPACGLGSGPGPEGGPGPGSGPASLAAHPEEGSTRAPRVGAAEASGIRHELAGFVHLVVDADPCWGSLVDKLHITNARRRGGLGSALLLRAARQAIERGTGRAFYLWVQEQNTAAQAPRRPRDGTCPHPGPWRRTRPPQRQPHETPCGLARRESGRPPDLTACRTATPHRSALAQGRLLFRRTDGCGCWSCGRSRAGPGGWLLRWTRWYGLAVTWLGPALSRATSSPTDRPAARRSVRSNARPRCRSAGPAGPESTGKAAPPTTCRRRGPKRQPSAGPVGQQAAWAESAGPLA